MRVVVLGGGGFRVPLIHRALSGAVAFDEFVLHDVDPARASVVEAVLRDPRARTAATLEDALDGADLVVSAVRVGGAAGRVDDERLALDLGVLGQETVGAGGLRYALRSLPVVAEHADAIARHAPDAWTLTMTNPAGIVTEVMARTLGPRVIGICDSPTGLVRRVGAALGLDVGDDLGSIGVDCDYLGVNHLGWLRAVRVDGVDRLPDFLADDAAIARTEEGRLFGADLVRALGAVPNEYLCWYYAARESLAGVVAAGRTRGEHVAVEQDRFYAAATAEPARAHDLWHAANDERNRSYFAELRDEDRDEADVAAGGYETVAAATAAALFGATGPATTVLNVPAGTAVPGVETDTVVEVVCRVDRSGATPLPVAPPTTHQLGLMDLVRSCERDAATAALTGSREAALRAFALHPLVGSVRVAEALVAASGFAGTPSV